MNTHTGQHIEEVEWCEVAMCFIVGSGYVLRMVAIANIVAFALQKAYLQSPPLSLER